MFQSQKQSLLAQVKKVQKEQKTTNFPKYEYLLSIEKIV